MWVKWIEEKKIIGISKAMLHAIIRVWHTFAGRAVEVGGSILSESSKTKIANYRFCWWLVYVKGVPFVYVSSHILYLSSPIFLTLYAAPKSWFSTVNPATEMVS